MRYNFYITDKITKIKKPIALNLQYSDLSANIKWAKFLGFQYKILEVQRKQH